MDNYHFCWDLMDKSTVNGHFQQQTGGLQVPEGNNTQQTLKVPAHPSSLSRGNGANLMREAGAALGSSSSMSSKAENDMGGSINGVTPQWMVYNGKSHLNG